MNQKDKSGKTPFGTCLDNENVELLQKLLSDISINKESQILHEISIKILNTKYQDILLKLLQNVKPTTETMNILNSTGMTPFLSYIEVFTTQYYTLKADMLQLVNSQADEHKDKIDNYKITNETLFDQ